MPCACGCSCCECPCPSALPTVLRTWAGSRDFTLDRDIRLMPGWTEELERFFAAAPCGYLWRVVGWDWQQIPFAPAPPSGWPQIGVGVADGEMLALGVVRDGIVYGNQDGGVYGSAFAGVGGLRYGTDTTTWPRKAGYFGGYVVAQPGPNFPPIWFWTGEHTQPGFGVHQWATYELQLGVIRCECKDGLYVVWPADGVNRPNDRILSVVQSNSLPNTPLIQRLEVPRTATRGRFSIKADVAEFPGNPATPIELPYDASNAAVKTAVESLTYYQSGGQPVFTAVTVTGGPLPVEPVLIQSTPTHPDPAFAALRVAAIWGKLRLRRNGFECRRMTALEEDARAWAGNYTDPLIPMPCQVDVLVDYDRTRFAAAYDRLGWIEPNTNFGPPFTSSPRLDDTDLAGVRVVILGVEGMATGIGSSLDPAAKLTRLADWLSEPGRVLVLNGAYVRDGSADACSVYSGTQSPFHHATGLWNYVLSAVGASTTLQGIGVPVANPQPQGCASVWGQTYSVATAIDGPPLGSTGTLSFTVTPTAATHPLMRHASGTISWSLSTPGVAPWAQFALDTVGNLIPGGNATVLYELTAAVAYYNSNRVSLAQPLPALVVEQLPSGSWVIVCGLLHVPGYASNGFGGYSPAPDLLAHLPTAFMADIVNKLPYA